MYRFLGHCNSYGPQMKRCVAYLYNFTPIKGNFLISNGSSKISSEREHLDIAILYLRQLTETTLFVYPQCHQLQITSTESFFITCGHGSPPKISGVTGTEHEFCPMQYLSKASYEWKAWQLPSRKLPQTP